MKLLTKAIETKLIENFKANQKTINVDGSTTDFKPALKLFSPVGAATWLISELDPDTNIMFGLCDLGFGFPELGDVSLDEIKSIRFAAGLGVERDMHWSANKTLSEYADAARKAGRIVSY